MIQLLFAIAALQPTPSADPVDVQVTAAGGGYDVRYSLPAAGVAVLDLMDMSAPSPGCPELAYDIETVSGAQRVAQDPDEARTVLSLRPDGAARIEVRYFVSSDSGDEITTDQPCDLLLARGPTAIMEGKALFLAPRPYDPAGEPFRFGETRLSFAMEAGQPVDASLGEPDPEGRWRVEAFDRIRFALFTAGPHSLDAPAMSVVALDPASATLDAGTLEIDLARAADRFAALFAAPAPERYRVVLIDAGAASGGDIIATARINAHVMVLGAAVSPVILRVVNVHELAHHWDLSAFRTLDRAEDLTWMREGLAEYLAYDALTASDAVPARAMIGRANRALHDQAWPRTPVTAPYDEGYLIWLTLGRADLREERFAGFLRGLIAAGQGPLTAAEFWSRAHQAGLWPDPEGRFSTADHMPCRLIAGAETFQLMFGFWPVYESGIDRDAAPNTQGVTVTPGGPAVRAGLRDGDQITRTLSGGYGEILRDLTVELADGRTLSWRPHGYAAASPFLQYARPQAEDIAPARAEPPERCR